jgi:hypothetical protein
MKLILTSICLLIVFVAHAQQQYVLSGKVEDNKAEAITDGEMFLLNASDSSLVKYASVDKGKFRFDPVEQGSYLLRTMCSGYITSWMSVQLMTNRELTVQADRDNNLQEVKVTASRPTISYAGDGSMVIDVERNSILSAIPNAMELLSKLPAVQVSSDQESVSVVDKGEAMIYLNNQRITINDLNSISTNDIESISIIRNPSAKYEAEGRVVILLKLKKKRADGSSLDLSETVSFKRYFHNRSGINAGLKKNGLELKANFQYSRLELWESNGFAFNIDNRGIESRYRAVSMGTRQLYNFGAGVYYQINPDDYISLSGMGRIHKEPFTIITASSLKEPGAQNSVLTNSQGYGKRPYANASLNYGHKLKKMNAQLFLGGQYSRYERQLTNKIYNNYNNTTEILNQDRYQLFGVDVYSGRADLEKTIWKGMKWESGINITRANSASTFDITDHLQTTAGSSEYVYTEGNHAVYTQLSGNIKKLQFTAGLRAENTVIEGGFRDSIRQVDQNYTQLFPKGSLSIPLDSSKTIVLNYSKSIARPSYSTTNQMTTYINPYYEWARNVNQNPSITDELTAALQYKDYNLQLSVFQSDNVVFDIPEYDAAANKLRMINRNLEYTRGLSMTLMVPLHYKIWTSDNLLSGGYYQTKDPAAVLYETKPNLYCYSNNQFRLPKGFDLMINGWLVTKRKDGLFDKNMLYQLDLGLSKTFFKKLSCNISWNDVFRSQNSEERFTINGVRANGTYYEDVKEFAITLRYRLGKIRDSKYSNRDVNENGGRIN